MEDPSRIELAEAANQLIDSEDAQDLYKKLRWVYEVASKGLPVRLVGRAAVINPLLVLMLRDKDAGERVLQLVERKREESELPSLEGDEGFDRKAYMRELMARKRERQRRLVHLHNQLRSELDKLKGADRIEFERVHANRWLTVRQEREDELRLNSGRRLTEEERKAIIAQLWVDVDAELDAYEKWINEELRKPVLNRTSEFKFHLQPKKEVSSD